jgi:hypothetical protein
MKKFVVLFHQTQKDRDKHRSNPTHVLDGSVVQKRHVVGRDWVERGEMCTRGRPRGLPKKYPTSDPLSRPAQYNPAVVSHHFSAHSEVRS